MNTSGYGAGPIGLAAPATPSPSLPPAAASASPPAPASALPPPMAAPAPATAPGAPPVPLPTAFPPLRSYLPPPMPPPGYVGGPGPTQPMMPPGVLGSTLAGPGLPRYSAPNFSTMARPQVYAPRPHIGPPPVAASSMPMSRPVGNGLRACPPPVLKPPSGMTLAELAAKGIGQLVGPAEKPHTTVYVGKISPAIEDDVLRTLLELCGPIKSWKRAQDPTNGSPKGFGFCEFESAEGVLRALRLLNKFPIEGQELVLNVNQATREYLERYVIKKKERDRILKEEARAQRAEEAAPGVEVVEPATGSKCSDKLDGIEDDAKKFGLVTEVDVESDESALQKMTSILEERARLRPPPLPPLPVSSDALGKASTAFDISKSKDADSGMDGPKIDDAAIKGEDDTAGDHKAPGEAERPDGSSSDRGRRTDRDRERDREREVEREKERELERYERERERERLKRERDRENRVREADRLYEEREREWEARERERERQRSHDRERERERERDRRREIKEQEEESDEDEWRKRRYRDLHDEKRKRRQREKEEDSADVVREEQEETELMRLKAREPVLADVEMESEPELQPDVEMEIAAASPVDTTAGFSARHVLSAKETSSSSASDTEGEQLQPELMSTNGTRESARSEKGGAAVAGDELEMKVSSSSPAPRKLGFGLMGSGRRATVPSVFHQEDEEEVPKERMLRPLVPIDYSAEEMLAVAPSKPVAAPSFVSNIAAAAEFAKSLSQQTGEDGERDRSRKDRSDEKDKGRRDKDRGRHRDRDRDRDRYNNREKDRERGKDRHVVVVEKAAVPESRILDAKHLIDTIPKTREELFAYPVDWKIYDKHELHERMRPWISKKITEFLGEEEKSLVEFIVNHTQKHVTAAMMLGLLESVLDDEAEMFVLKMWRMLIFEIRRVETGLSRSKA